MQTIIICNNKLQSPGILKSVNFKIIWHVSVYTVGGGHIVFQFISAMPMINTASKRTLNYELCHYSRFFSQTKYAGTVL